MQLSELLTPARERDMASSGVSWDTVVGGAFVAAALSLILLALGAGFGLSVVSPWSNVGAGASTVGPIAIVWLILTEIVASSISGYLAGWPSTKGHAIHNDEVHFRDTANGFLVWAVSVVVTVRFLGAAPASLACASAATSEEASKSADGARLILLTACSDPIILAGEEPQSA